MIGDDKLLASTLAAELDRRGALPDSGTVVLLTERDTAYGRQFAESFKKAVQEHFGELAKYQPPQRQWQIHKRQQDICDNIRTFRFLRGIDGATPDRRAAATAAGGQTSEDGKQQPAAGSADTNDSQPHGRSQKDYLSRLEQSLVELHENQQLIGRTGVSAMGVVGSDVYDKLLILRALRKRFPTAVFFTTDLDAAFLQPDEQKTARNPVS